MRIKSGLASWSDPPSGPVRIHHRLHQLASELDLERERMLRYGIAHALDRGFSAPKVEADMIECARLRVAARS